MSNHTLWAEQLLPVWEDPLWQGLIYIAIFSIIFWLVVRLVRQKCIIFFKLLSKKFRNSASYSVPAIKKNLSLCIKMGVLIFIQQCKGLLKKFFSLIKHMSSYSRIRMAFATIFILILVWTGADFFRMQVNNSHAKRALEQIIQQSNPNQTSMDSIDCDATGGDTLQVLMALNEINTNHTYYSIVGIVSDWHFNIHNMGLSKHIVESLIFARLECSLRKKALALLQSKLLINTELNPQLRLTNYIRELANYHQSYNIFLELAGPLITSTGVSEKFIKLLNYLYEMPPQQLLFKDTNLLIRAIQLATYVSDDRIYRVIEEIKTRPLKEIVLLAQNVREHENIAIASIEKLNYLTQPNNVSFNNLIELNNWVLNISKNWLGTYRSSPCGRINQELEPLVKVLINTGFYSTDYLSQILQQFSQSTCFAPVLEQLSSMNVLHFKPVVESIDGGLVLNKQLSRLSYELGRLESLTFTKVANTPPMNKSQKSNIGWNLPVIEEAIYSIVEYQEFKATYWNPDASSFYEPALLAKLRDKVNSLIQQAALRGNIDYGTTTSAKHHIEMSLEQKMRSFRVALPSLLILSQSLEDLNLHDSNQQLKQLIHTFIQSQSEGVDQLMQLNHLYLPNADPD